MSDRNCIAMFALWDSAAAASLADAPLPHPQRVRCRYAAAALLIIPLTYIDIRTFSRLCDLRASINYVNFSDATLTINRPLRLSHS